MKSILDRLSRFRNLLRYLRLKPFDTSTEHGRSAERHRRIALTVVANVAGRFLSMVVPLVTIPLTLFYLGKEQYGIWMTLSSITASLWFADLGIGMGFINKFTECIGRDEREMARVYVSSAFLMLATIAVTLGVAYTIAAPFIQWNHFFKAASPASMHSVPAAMAIFLLCFLLNLPLGVVERTYYGMQEGYYVNVSLVIANLFYLLDVVIAVKANLGLVGLICMSSGMPVLRLIVNGIRLFFIQRPWLRPSLSTFSFPAAKSLLGIGFLFFLLNISSVISYSLDNLVISSIRGASAVSDYVVASKLFAIMTGIVMGTTWPLWPALVEAASIGDMPWVKKTFRRYILMILGVTIPSSIVLYFCTGIFIRIWTHNQLHTSSLVLIVLGIWSIVGGIGNFLTTFLNAMNELKFQVATYSVASIINLVCSIWLTKIYGAPGVVMGSIIAQFLLLVAIFGYKIPRIFARLTKEGEERRLTVKA